MDGIIDMCRDVFPWISNQLTRLGLETQDNRFAQLGGELFIFTQQISPSNQTGTISNLVNVAHLINKACSSPKTKYVRENAPYNALRRILEVKDSNTADKILISDVRRNLLQFVRQSPEYPSLLHFIADCLQETDSLDALPEDEIRLYNEDPKYTMRVNNTLYTQLRMHSTCSCSTQHLESARLRLDPEHDEQENADILFDMLFVSGPALYFETNCHIRWKEAKILVARQNESPYKKQVSFAVQSSNPSLRARSKSPLPSGLRKVQLGEFCRLIGSEKSTPIHFHIQNNVMKLAGPACETTARNFLPQASISLAEWLEQTVHLSNRTKVTLAYIIARSVWRYYNSYWMAKPWTHENIQIMKEKISNRNHIQPHLYFTTKLHKCKDQLLDYCIADDLIHMYPSILALGVVLIEIAAKLPFKPEGPHYLWDETTINDYYEWAWTTANCSNSVNTIGDAYQAVVNNCLDAELFRNGPIDPSKPDRDLETRQSLLYEKVVLPLRGLYHAYKDDWDIQELPRLEIPPKAHQTEHISRSRPVNRSEFTIAIFCALPLEADAVIELFKEIWGEEDEDYGKAVGDDNTYTLGKILHHNVVLVHMAGMGKGAASQAASSLRSSYPEIKLALVVGVCGGVPSHLDGKYDLILGDVVISDGIVQYDYGRQFPDAFLSKSGPEIVARPGPKIRGMLAKLKGEPGRERVERKLSQHLRVLQDKLGQKRARYPGTDKDELFQSAYRHKHQDPAECRLCSACEGGMNPVCEEARSLTCQQLGCQKRLLVPRKRLHEASKGCPPRPKIHFGFVGSGDTIMKSGQHRDETAARHNIIAYEMEASGIWDNLPSLVIKGVCDYADSHKNKYWQHYAAATAAACMKAVLEVW
ncbi:hypothetical protein BGW36DRAFT_355458 [Talaromyces proteolyticus]|uniref:Nucleoside phosphorylase domain-containing protein n=1 Tax=Talaromyces proteolyticus TaxID=1131652 RepID=A0AAD4L3S0_9EURO|nr:uncharacterized protein BGW36DRAFT_355458 [Talaromyces proteolyticus]KAH8704079.1 hypothetical protein BGW36DRAFT_355458 [Talaromyces proteolyticus]